MNFDEIEIRCTQVSNAFASIEDDLLAWANARLKTELRLTRYLQRHPEQVSRMPENWTPMLLAQYTAGAVLCNPGTTKKYIKAFRDDLSGDELDLVKAFQRTPWYYRLFTVSESLGGYFHTIIDEDTNDESLLYSEAITNLLREKKRLFLCLLFDNGQCCQTFGMLHTYAGFSGDDIRMFSRLTVGRQATDTTVAEAMKRDPLPTYFLDVMSEIPPTSHKGEPVVHVAHTYKGVLDPETIRSALLPFCTIEDNDSVLSFRCDNDADPLSSAAAYLDMKSSTLTISSNLRSAYDRIAEALFAADRGMNQFLNPAWDVSIMMFIAIKKILDISAPGAEYEPETVLPEEGNSELNSYNLALGELSAAYNNGYEVSIQEILDKYDLPAEAAKSFEEILRGFGKNEGIDLDGGIGGYTPPPPSVRLKFAKLLSASKNVRFSEDEPPGFEQLLDSLDEELSDLGYKSCSWLRYPKLIEDLYFSKWPDSSPTVLMYTMYLLNKAGDQFHTVSDYAAEILRLFWQVLLPSKNTRAFGRFVSDYSRLCLSVFEKAELVEIAGNTGRESVRRGTFRMKASELFLTSIDFDWT